MNDYFPSCNLARLYRLRNEDSDAKRAIVAAAVTEVACERARRKNSADPWLKPTLLGAAFDAGDVGTARALAKDVARDGPATWQLRSTIDDLERSITFLEDPKCSTELIAICAQLKELWPRPTVADAQ